MFAPISSQSSPVQPEPAGPRRTSCIYKDEEGWWMKGGMGRGQPLLLLLLLLLLVAGSSCIVYASYFCSRKRWQGRAAEWEGVHLLPAWPACLRCCQAEFYICYDDYDERAVAEDRSKAELVGLNKTGRQGMSEGGACAVLQCQWRRCCLS